jgi:hypothetical protein
MARNDGRVQTQELNIFQPIQPAPMAGSTFVRAPEAPRDNALLQIADSLSSVSQGLGAWARNQRMQRGIDAQDDKKQAEIAATIDAAKYANDPAGYMGELAKQQTTYRRDAYAAHAGLLYAQRFQTEAADWYDTKFDKEKGDILTDSNGFRNQYAAEITDPASKAAFLDATQPMMGKLIGGHQQYLETRLGEERVQGASAHYDLVVQQYLRAGITNPALLQKNLEAAAREAKDKRGIALTGKENDEALMNVANMYATRGDVDSVKTILSVGRGGRGSLLSDPEHAVNASRAIQAAEATHNEKALAANKKNIADIESRVNQGIASEDDYAKMEKMGIPDQAIIQQRVENETRREAALQKLREMSEKDAALKQYETVKHARSSAYIAAIESGETPTFNDVQIPNKEHTSTENYSVHEQRKDTIAAFEERLDGDVKAEEAAHGAASANHMRLDRTLKFYSSPSIHDVPEAWKQSLNGVGSSYDSILASKGEVPQNVQDAYNVWLAMEAKPAMRDQAITDADSRLFLEAVDWARRDPRQDPKAAMVLAAQIMEKKAKGELPEFNPARKDINSAIASNLNHWGWFHSDTATVDASVQAEISNSAKLYYYANRGDWDAAVAAASKDYAETHTLINGRPVYTNFRGAPQDFGELAQDRLDFFVRSFGGTDSNKDVASKDDLYLQPVGPPGDAAGAAWVVMKQGDTNFGPLMNSEGKPVVMTMADIDYARDAKSRAHQAQVVEENRQATLNQPAPSVPLDPRAARGAAPQNRYVGGNVPKSPLMKELERSHYESLGWSGLQHSAYDPNILGLGPNTPGLGPDGSPDPMDNAHAIPPSGRSLLDIPGLLPDRSRGRSLPVGHAFKGLYSSAEDPQHHPMQGHYASPPRHEIATATSAAANELGVRPEDLLTAISYETVGSFRPNKFGGKGGNYMGLIQFGPTERRQYGATPGQSYTEQMGAVVRYLKDRGVKPGMGLLDIYSAINAGRPGRYHASDRPGYTVARHVQEMMLSYHRRRAVKMLGLLAENQPPNT